MCCAKKWSKVIGCVKVHSFFQNHKPNRWSLFSKRCLMQDSHHNMHSVWGWEHFCMIFPQERNKYTIVLSLQFSVAWLALCLLKKKGIMQTYLNEFARWDLEIKDTEIKMITLNSSFIFYLLLNIYLQDSKLHTWIYVPRECLPRFSICYSGWNRHVCCVVCLLSSWREHCVDQKLFCLF